MKFQRKAEIIERLKKIAEKIPPIMHPTDDEMRGRTTGVKLDNGTYIVPSTYKGPTGIIMQPFGSTEGPLGPPVEPEPYPRVQKPPAAPKIEPKVDKREEPQGISISATKTRGIQID